MYKLTALLAGILCIVLVNGRHYADRGQDDNIDDDDQVGLRRHRERSGDQTHRRRRWQANYGYDYQPHSYYPDRRSSYDHNQDVITDIYRRLDELSAYIKREKQQLPQQPPAIPQPIYIPYPVPYSVPQYVNCRKPSTNLTYPTRNAFQVMSDANQNWGFDIKDVIDYEDDGADGSRDISFEPLKSEEPLSRPAPKVEHGSSQAGTTPVPLVAPKIPTSPPQTNKLNSCGAAVLSCCGYSDQTKRRQCFGSIGCDGAYNNDACSKEAIDRALESFKLAYAPAKQ